MIELELGWKYYEYHLQHIICTLECMHNRKTALDTQIHQKRNISDTCTLYHCVKQ